MDRVIELCKYREDLFEYLQQRMHSDEVWLLINRIWVFLALGAVFFPLAISSGEFPFILLSLFSAVCFYACAVYSCGYPA